MSNYSEIVQTLEGEGILREKLTLEELDGRMKECFAYYKMPYASKRDFVCKEPALVLYNPEQPKDSEVLLVMKEDEGEWMVQVYLARKEAGDIKDWVYEADILGCVGEGLRRLEEQ